MALTGLVEDWLSLRAGDGGRLPGKPGGAGAAEPATDIVHDVGERFTGNAAGRCRPKPDNVAALAGGEIVPQAGLGAGELDRKAVTFAAVDITDNELAALDDAVGQQIGQRAAKVAQQPFLDALRAFDLKVLAHRRDAVWVLRRRVVEVAPAVDVDHVVVVFCVVVHGPVLQQRFVFQIIAINGAICLLTIAPLSATITT